MVEWTANQRFWSFLDRHIERNPRGDWPPIGADSEYWSAFRAVLVKHGVSEATADDASRLMTEDGPPFPGEHTKAFLALVRLAWSRSEVQEVASSREAAELASRSCLDCGGLGLATRYRHRSAAPNVARTAEFYCLCPMGRWVENEHAKKSPDLRKRIPDLADHPDFQLAVAPWSGQLDNRFRYPPELWDDFHERPIEAPATLAGFSKRPRIKAVEPAPARRPSPVGPQPTVALGPDGRPHEALPDGRAPWTAGRRPEPLPALATADFGSDDPHAF